MINQELKEMFTELKRGQEEIYTELKESIENLKIGQEKLIKRVDRLEEKQEQISKEMNNISLSVARIEVEHGEKLGILLDVVTGHTEKFSSVNKRVEKCEKRLDNHDNKFYILKSAVQAY